MRHPVEADKTTGIVKPRIIAFEVTQRCPLNCRHCRAGANIEKADNLSTDQCRAILKGIADYSRCVVILTGGEPMERKDIYELAQYGRSVGLRMVMATCGYHINRETAARLKAAGIIAISFSIDGADARSHDAFRQTPGAYDSVIRAIDVVKQAGIKFQINTTVTRKNISEVADISRLAIELGAYCFNPFILVPVGRGHEISDLILSPQEYENLLKEMAALKQNSSIEVRLTCGPQFARVARQEKIDGCEKTTGCLAATGFAFIGHTGDVQTCGFLNISAGNMIENDYSFENIWTGSEFLNSLRDESKYHGPCGKCPYNTSCRGCRARAYTMLGDFLETDPICSLANRMKGQPDG